LPAVSLRTANNRTLWRAQLIMLCTLVFMFALHAKTAVYDGGTQSKITPSTASKLWVNGQKMEVSSINSSAAVLFWIAALSLYGIRLHQESLVRSAFIPPVPRILPLQYLHRFLRPPPAHI
jgi:hypothetical protein